MRSSLAFAFALSACDRNEPKMNDDNLPDGWAAGEVVPYDQTSSDPPASPDPLRVQFYGLRSADPGHRLYSVPVETEIAEIVRVFEVGAHGADSYGYDPDETVEMVSEKATKIAELLPCRVIFVDCAGLILKFFGQIEDSHLDRLLELFPEDEGFQSGAEAYINEQEEGRHLFHRVKEENLFHFWWD